MTRLVLRQGLALMALGVVAGLAASTALTRLMSALLYGVNALDPPVIAVVVAGLIAVGGLAALLPARRAAGVDPVDALRWE